MKYISLDLETSSLQPSPDHILQVSMVVEDTEQPEVPVEDLPHFTCFVNHADIKGQAYALGMNGWILDIISGRKENTTDYPIYAADERHRDYWIDHALEFLDHHFSTAKITVAGKNVAGFDIPFLTKELSRHFRHRVLDPGPLFVDWAKDESVPDFKTCKERAGMSGEVVHCAREDAMEVITMLRRFYNKGN